LTSILIRTFTNLDSLIDAENVRGPLDKLSDLLDSKNRSTRLAAAIITGNIDAPGVFELLKKASEHSDEIARYWAARALAKHRTARSSIILIEMVKDVNEAMLVKTQAARSLGELREKAALEPLLELLLEADKETDKFLIEKLERTKSEEGAQASEETVAEEAGAGESEALSESEKEREALLEELKVEIIAAFRKITGRNFKAIEAPNRKEFRRAVKKWEALIRGR